MKWPWYLLLLAVFPILSLYAHNIDEVSLTDVWLPLGIAIVGVAVVALPIMLLTKQYAKVGIIFGCFLLLFYGYGYARDFIMGFGRFPMFGITDFLLGGGLAAFVLLTLLVVRHRGNFAVLTRALNIAVVVLVAIPTVGIVAGEMRLAGKSDTVKFSGDIEDWPDIYYIVLDMYANQDAMREVCGYDNNEFIDYLEATGFYVVEDGRSNYGGTVISMASSLNMRYPEPDERHDMPKLRQMIRDNEVARFLKARGYSYLFITGSWQIKGMGKYSDEALHRESLGLEVSRFADRLCHSTMLSAFVKPYYRSTADDIKFGCRMLRSVPSIEGPTFVYAHIMSPHPPFLLTGTDMLEFNEKTKRWSSIEGWEEGYISNVVSINAEMVEVIESILAESTKSVIILQADHGIWDAYHGIIGGRFEILNAYYLPDGENLLYETITPVNTFRVVFNHCFDTDFEILEDTGDKWDE